MYYILIAQFWIVGAWAQDISLRIATETGRTQFRVGEQIGLTLTFETAETSSPDKWMVAVNGRDRSVLGLANDRFLVSPQPGASDPLSYRFGEGVVYSGPGGMYLHGKTNVAHLDLNQWVRFERPGNYLVRALFHATASHGRDASLHSNELAIEIVAGGAAWQSDEVRDDVAILSSVPAKPDNESFEARMNAARRLSYLDTADSVFEATRLLGTADVQVGQILQTWLQATRSRDVAVAAMKQLLRSADQPVTPAFLDTLATLESWRRIPPANPPSVPESRRRYEIRAAIAEQLRIDLAAAIDRKHGAARAISMKTLLDNMPPEVVPARLRSEIAALFAELPAAQQSELLNGQWNKIAGPGMIPALRRIYDSVPGTNEWAPAIVATAVERLYELDPGPTRQLLLDELSRPRPRLPFRTLAILPDATLPGIDKTLLEHLERERGGEAEELIARYATSGILD
ncbi:MAG TPA: hypothetical protein VHB50_09865, partial [Bryobacteraceae bacterium]|nr:hypothetical protein [Bryobacteraceae bacterium]